MKYHIITQYDDKICDLIHQYAQEKSEENLDFNYIKENFLDYIQDNEKHIIVASENGKYVWYLIYEIQHKKNILKPKVTFSLLLYLFVSPEHRWKWISSELHNYYVDILKQNNITISKLHVWVKNIHAQNIYDQWWYQQEKYYLKKSLSALEK